MSIQAVSSLGLLRTMLLRSFLVYISLNVYAFLLGLYLGLEFLGHVHIYATILTIAKQFSKMVLHCIFCSHSDRFHDSAFSPILDIVTSHRSDGIAVRLQYISLMIELSTVSFAYWPFGQFVLSSTYCSLFPFICWCWVLGSSC